ncbi:MAG TPA: lysophospholipid acyltransferase family protein [Paracoccaceae bacterium]|nr:lysophospholipid acyltransferase family protein [Paracoccaceae bacterium]HMO72428.1 lysophospholipid acyltransferase family protein [Paracoccaceae bacterium]
MTPADGDWRKARLAPWRPGPAERLRGLLRGAVIGVVTYGCLIPLLVLRIPERLFCGHRRPLTPFITQFVCRSALRLMGLRLTVEGRPMQGQGAIVANHASWLDIFVLNACDRVFFVAKSEVGGWPGIGWLARATGTVFIARNGAEARAQTALFETRLHLGHRLLFFPEGTSTDALRVLPFKSTLFAAFLAPGLRDDLSIQPVSVAYRAPPGADPRLYGWWDDMDFGPHFLRVLAQSPQGAVHVTFHPPRRAADFPDRKALAAACEAAVRAGHAARQGAGPTRS